MQPDDGAPGLLGHHLEICPSLRKKDSVRNLLSRFLAPERVADPADGLCVSFVAACQGGADS